MNRILEKQLRYDMDRLLADFRLMFDLVHLGLTESVEALRDVDRSKAYGVVLRDSRIDNLESTIDRHCLEFLVKHSPAASHLRFVYSAAKISFELERIGDYAEAIARQSISLSYGSAHCAVKMLVEMSVLPLKMLEQAVKAFLESDVKLAINTFEMDSEVDECERKIYETLTGEDVKTAAQAKQIYSLLSVANRLERVADQSCNICEEVVYMATGEMLKHHHEKERRVLFLCVGNACRSQMAQAIGKRLTHDGRFQFESAGSKPQKKIDPYLVDFLKTKGIDLKGQKPKSLSEAGSLDGFDVVVSLCREACVVLPKLPFRTVALEWDLEDPTVKPSGERERTYAKIYQLLETNIRDLIQALEQ